MRARLFALTLALAAIGSMMVPSASPAAEQYSASVTAQRILSTTGNEWVYLVRNTSPSPDYVIWLLQIEVDEQTTVMGASSPQFWHADLNVPGLVFWSTSQSGGYIQSGTSQDAFQASYDSEPAYQYWTVMFKNVTVPGDTPVDFGDVLVPEPGSAAVLIGLAALTPRLIRRRR